MFRKVRKKINEISEEEARKLLTTERRGIIAINGDNGYPYAVPINYLYSEDENKIYFHGSRIGYKSELIQKDEKICFTLYGNETVKKEEWAPFVRSTVVFGRCRIIEDREETISVCRRFASKYYPDSETVEEELKLSGRAVYMYEITIENITGKEVQEK